MWKFIHKTLYLIDKNILAIFVISVVVTFFQVNYIHGFGLIPSIYSVLISLGLVLLGPIFFLPGFIVMLKVCREINPNVRFVEVWMLTIFSCMSFFAAIYYLVFYPWVTYQEIIEGLPPISFGPAALGMYWASRKSQTPDK